MPVSFARPGVSSRPAPGAQAALVGGNPSLAGAAPRATNAAVNLNYVAGSPVRVRGAVTGRQYDFSGLRPTQAVDARDAAGLLRTSLFRAAP